MANNPYDPMAPMQSQVSHNQRMADVMRMQSLQPIQNVGASPLSEVSPFQALAQVMGAYASNKMQERATQGQTDMVQAMQSHTNQGLEQYMSEYQGDPRGAVMRAMQSPSPVVRTMATQELKGLMTPKTLAGHATDASVIGSGGNLNQFQAKNELKTVEPGKPLMDQSGNIVAPNIQPGAGQTLESINGDLYGRTPTGVDQINKAPRVTTTVNSAPTTVIGGQKAGMKEFFTNAAKQVDELGTQAAGATHTLSSLDQLEALEKGGIFSNKTSAAATFVANIAQAVGFKLTKEDQAKLANTETHQAATTDLWQKLIASMDGNKFVTEKEAMMMQQAQPLAAHSPDARKLIANTLRNAAHRQIQAHDKANSAYVDALQTEDIGHLKDIMKEVYIPNNSNIGAVPGMDSKANSSSGAMSLEDYLKSVGK